jgi:hypothetical protein
MASVSTAPLRPVEHVDDGSPDLGARHCGRLGGERDHRTVVASSSADEDA